MHLTRWEEQMLPHVALIAALVDSLMPEDGVLLDAGANMGQVSEIVLADHPYRCAHLFEPVPPYAERCRERMAGLPAEVHPVGLSDIAAECLIYANDRNLGWNTLDTTYADPAHMHAYCVPVVPLDSFVFPRVDAIKIDVESWEGKVLKGAHQTITRCRPVIVMELSYGSSAQMWEEKVVEIERLFSLGYERTDYRIDAGTRDIVLIPR